MLSVETVVTPEIGTALPLKRIVSGHEPWTEAGRPSSNAQSVKSGWSAAKPSPGWASDVVRILRMSGSSSAVAGLISIATWVPFCAR